MNLEHEAPISFRTLRTRPSVTARIERKAPEARTAKPAPRADGCQPPRSESAAEGIWLAWANTATPA